MESVNRIFGIREQTSTLSRPERQSVEQTEDYAFKQVVHTKELYVDGVAITSTAGTPHTPTLYRGTDFTGTNPTKTLTHSRTLPVNARVTIGRLLIRGEALDPLNEYEISGDTITMVSVDIDDADVIIVED